VNKRNPYSKPDQVKGGEGGPPVIDKLVSETIGLELVQPKLNLSLPYTGGEIGAGGTEKRNRNKDVEEASHCTWVKWLTSGGLGNYCVPYT